MATNHTTSKNTNQPTGALARKRAKDAKMKALLEEVNSDLRQDGVNYTARDLVAMRRDQVREELTYGDEVVFVKVPSGSEVSIPADLAEYLLRTTPRTSAW